MTGFACTARGLCTAEKRAARGRRSAARARHEGRRQEMAFRIALALAVCAEIASPQALWHVDVNATPPGNGTVQSPYTSIQHAVSRPSTQSGDRIVVAPGTYHEIVDFLGKTLVVRSSAGAESTVIDGSGLHWTIVTI